MPSSAQSNARSMIIDTQGACGHNNAKAAMLIDVNPSSISRYITNPDLISEKSGRRVVTYWADHFLPQMNAAPAIANELKALRAASVKPTVDYREHIEEHLDLYRLLLASVPAGSITEIVTRKYLLGLALFILYTSRDRFQRLKNTAEMDEALELLESALAMGTQHKILSDYMATRMAMQVDGGHYNLREHELLTNFGLLIDMRVRLGKGAVANCWKLHGMIVRDPTPLHNGLVFCCVLDNVAEGRKFLDALKDLDEGFEDPLFCRDGLSELGNDPLVLKYARQLYAKEYADKLFAEKAVQ